MRFLMPKNGQKITTKMVFLTFKIPTVMATTSWMVVNLISTKIRNLIALNLQPINLNGWIQLVLMPCVQKEKVRPMPLTCMKLLLVLSHWQWMMETIAVFVANVKLLAHPQNQTKLVVKLMSLMWPRLTTIVVLYHFQELMPALKYHWHWAVPQLQSLWNL